jgi:hypothetical protein
VLKNRFASVFFIILILALASNLGLSDSRTIPRNVQEVSGTKLESEWHRTYGWRDDAIASSVAQTADNGFILAGTIDEGYSRTDMWLVKTDAQGVVQWNQTYGNHDRMDPDYAASVLQTADGGFVLAGTTGLPGTGRLDMWLVKTDASGVAQWNQTYGMSRYPESAASVLQTADGGFVLVARFGWVPVDDDFWLVKTDASGVAQWNQTYGGMDLDYAASVLQTADGGFVLAGTTDPYGAGDSDFWLVKTDASGVAQWNQTYGGTGDDWAPSVLQTADGGFVLAGTTTSYGAGETDMWLVKTDASGVAQWNQTYGKTGMDRAACVLQPTSDGFDHGGAACVLQTADGGFVLAGTTQESYQVGNYDMWLVKTDVSGVAQYDQTYGEATDMDRAACVIQTADGGFILAGTTQEDHRGITAVLLIKISAPKDSKGIPGGDPLPLLAALLVLSIWHMRKKRKHESDGTV